MERRGKKKAKHERERCMKEEKSKQNRKQKATTDKAEM